MKTLKIPAKGLDDIIIKPGQITVIAAPRLHGKSTFAANLAEVWGRDIQVCLSVIHPSVIPEGVNRGEFHTHMMYGEIDDFAAAMLRLRPDVIIMDELHIGPRNPRFAPRSDLFSLRAIAKRLNIPIVCIVSRTPLVDAMLDAAIIHALDGNLPEVEKETMV